MVYSFKEYFLFLAKQKTNVSTYTNDNTHKNSLTPLCFCLLHLMDHMMTD